VMVHKARRLVGYSGAGRLAGIWQVWRGWPAVMGSGPIACTRVAVHTGKNLQLSYHWTASQFAGGSYMAIGRWIRVESSKPSKLI
jgi:hypothetical protein